GPKVAAAFAAGQAYVDDVPMRRADGSRFWAHLRGRPVDAANSTAGTIWTVTDVTAEVTARAQLEWTANHDMLTGLANRKALEHRLTRSFDAQPASLPAALVMIDLDRFKPVNDAAGHAAGDAMLQAVAGVLRARVRSRDLAVRLGGDEFALLLDHCPLDAALVLAEDVRAAIAGIELAWGEHRLGVGASLGVAALAPEMPDVAAWLHAADEACYAAQAAGRDTVRAAAARPVLRVVRG
ncbi:MAG: GGDEF domain-containing protein, partial [Ideonella sp.]|nr:GGDEF domain-containing protein [Ideonella sp.]